jgi:anti-sigma factor RsiW
LPAEFAATLTRLARMGHAQGLRHALERLAQAHPACAAQVETLRALVDRLAFDELIEQLAPALDLTDPEAM